MSSGIFIFLFLLSRSNEIMPIIIHMLTAQYGMFLSLMFIEEDSG